MNIIIRHLKENWVKYGLETIVVIVGILGAFALNNWNENIKKKTLEVETLKEIHVSLRSNFDMIKSVSDVLKQDIEKINLLVNYLETEKPFSETLEELLYYPFRANSIIVNRSAYEMLENRGLDLISNKSLRNNVVDLYNFRLPVMEDFIGSERDRIDEFRIYYQTKVVPITNESFVGHTGRSYPKITPINYQDLVGDEGFIGQLKWRISRTEMIIDRVESIWGAATKELEIETLKEISKLE